MINDVLATCFILTYGVFRAIVFRVEWAVCCNLWPTIQWLSKSMPTNQQSTHPRRVCTHTDRSGLVVKSPPLFNRLHYDTVMHILAFLPILDLAHMERTCPFFLHEVACQPRAWRTVNTRILPSSSHALATDSKRDYESKGAVSSIIVPDNNKLQAIQKWKVDAALTYVEHQRVTSVRSQHIMHRLVWVFKCMSTLLAVWLIQHIAMNIVTSEFFSTRLVELMITMIVGLFCSFICYMIGFHVGHQYPVMLRLLIVIIGVVLGGFLFFMVLFCLVTLIMEPISSGILTMRVIELNGGIIPTSRPLVTLYPHPTFAQKFSDCQFDSFDASDPVDPRRIECYLDVISYYHQLDHKNTSVDEWMLQLDRTVMSLLTTPSNSTHETNSSLDSVFGQLHDSCRKSHLLWSPTSVCHCSLSTYEVDPLFSLRYCNLVRFIVTSALTFNAATENSWSHAFVLPELDDTVCRLNMSCVSLNLSDNELQALDIVIRQVRRRLQLHRLHTIITAVTDRAHYHHLRTHQFKADIRESLQLLRHVSWWTWIVYFFVGCIYPVYTVSSCVLIIVTFGFVICVSLVPKRVIEGIQPELVEIFVQRQSWPRWRAFLTRIMGDYCHYSLTRMLRKLFQMLIVLNILQCSIGAWQLVYWRLDNEWRHHVLTFENITRYFPLVDGLCRFVSVPNDTDYIVLFELIETHRKGWGIQWIVWFLLLCTAARSRMEIKYCLVVCCFMAVLPDLATKKTVSLPLFIIMMTVLILDLLLWITWLHRHSRTLLRSLSSLLTIAIVDTC